MSVLSLAPGELMSFSAAVRRLPGHPHPSTLWRWRTRGIRGVRLDTVLIGGRRYVSADALERFVFALTAAADRSEHTPERTTATQERLRARGLA